MLYQDFHNMILLDPAKAGMDCLCIVSGYGTSAMALNQINHLQRFGCQVNISLVLGMTCFDGLTENNHIGFTRLVSNSFDCRYITKGPCVHSKVYCWLKDNKPALAFMGSANYTFNGFWGQQREIMNKCDENHAFAYFNSLIKDSLECTHPDIKQFINIYKTPPKRKIKKPKAQKKLHKGIPLNDFDFLNEELNPVTLSLLSTRTGETHHGGGGLNWGQRGSRNPNESYIPIPRTIQRMGFFPPIRVPFNVRTDDGKIMICTRGGDGGKNLHTPESNSILGKYFRDRLGMGSGAYITLQDLKNYGRTDVSFIKIDDQNYYMDFSLS